MRYNKNVKMFMGSIEIRQSEQTGVRLAQLDSLYS